MSTEIAVHFGHQDRLWHIYTPDACLRRAQAGAIMHARPEDGVRLIQVPMMPWGAHLPALRDLAQAPSTQILSTRAHWLDETERARCRQVIRGLTQRQREVLRAFAMGKTPQQVAEELCITIKCAAVMATNRAKSHRWVDDVAPLA